MAATSATLGGLPLCLRPCPSDQVATVEARRWLTVQLDVGIGDAVTPMPEWIDYPSLLDLPRPRLRAYRPETTIAEKLHAKAFRGHGSPLARPSLP